MEASLLPYLLTAIGSWLLGGTFNHTRAHMHNRLQRSKPVEEDIAADDRSRDRLRNILDDITQIDIRRKQEKLKLSKEWLEYALELAGKSAEKMIPNADDQTRAEYIERKFSRFEKQLGDTITNKKIRTGVSQKSNTRNKSRKL